MASLAHAMRRLRFRLLERLVLPAAMLAFRLLMRSWRVEPFDPALLARLAVEPRVMFTCWHGSLLNTMAFRHLFRGHGRRWVGLVTPSLDGRLLAAALKHLDVESAPLADGVRGITGASGFVQSVAAGSVGAIAADGPRGPRRVAKEGIARTAVAADAALVVAGVAATRGVQLPTWDRAQLAGPFARIHVCCRLLSTADRADRAAIQAALDAAQREAEGLAKGR